MKALYVLATVVVVLTAIACGGEPPRASAESTAEQEQNDAAPKYASYPANVRPCLHAMNQLELPAGSNLMGVVERSEVCAISISFDSQADIDAFIRARSEAGLPPESVVYTGPGDAKREIELELYVGEGTVPH